MAFVNAHVCVFVRLSTYLARHSAILPLHFCLSVSFFCVASGLAMHTPKPPKTLHVGHPASIAG